MPIPSPLVTAVFCAIVLVVAIAIVMAARRAGSGVLPIVLLLVAYLLVPAALAARGVLDRYDPMPAPALIVVLALTLVTIGVSLSRVGGTLVRRTAVGAIVALQAFRIPVEWCLHRLYAEGIVPVQMTYAGRNFDIITGITALALGGWLLSGRPTPRGIVLLWNVIGLLLLLNIVAIALLSTPVPFRRFTEGPANLLPSMFPFVWLPTFLVQVALASHLLVFRYVAGKPAE